MQRARTLDRFHGYWTKILEPLTPVQPLISQTVVVNQQPLISNPAAPNTEPKSNLQLNVDIAHHMDRPNVDISHLIGTPIVDIDARLQKLVKPAPPETCCMSGCVHCVWDIYQEDMEEYNLQRQQLLAFRRTLDPSTPDFEPQSAIDVDPTVQAFRDFERSKKANST